MSRPRADLVLLTPGTSSEARHHAGTFVANLSTVPTITMMKNARGFFLILVNHPQIVLWAGYFPTHLEAMEAAERLHPMLLLLEAR